MYMLPQQQLSFIYKHWLFNTSDSSFLARLFFIIVKIFIAKMENSAEKAHFERFFILSFKIRSRTSVLGVCQATYKRVYCASNNQ